MNRCWCVNVGSTSNSLKEQEKSCFPSYTPCNTKSLCVETISNYLISSGAFLILMMKPSAIPTALIRMHYLWIWSCLLERTGARPSISSKKMMEGLMRYACQDERKTSPDWMITHLTLQNSWRENRAWHLFYRDIGFTLNLKRQLVIHYKNQQRGKRSFRGQKKIKIIIILKIFDTV